MEGGGSIISRMEKSVLAPKSYSLVDCSSLATYAAQASSAANLNLIIIIYNNPRDIAVPCKGWFIITSP